jgi:hypothetical protein
MKTAWQLRMQSDDDDDEEDNLDSVLSLLLSLLSPTFTDIYYCQL